MSMVTVKRSEYESELLVLASILEAEGIPYFLKNQYSAQILKFGSNFQVELQVHTSDLEEVRRILEEYEQQVP